MISLYTGSVGSGKSYHGIELGLEWLRNGKNVIANFPILPPDKYLFKKSRKRWEERVSRWDFRNDITVEYLMATSISKGWFGKESQCLVVIDEAGILFNSRDWQTEKGSRDKWIKFLSQSRKFGYDFIFVCQSDRMIDRQIRGLVEYEVKHYKLNNSFMLKWLSVFKVTCFMYVYKWYHTKTKGKGEMSFYKKTVADRYDTMRVFNLDDLIENTKKLYEGKVMPSNLVKQLKQWEDDLKDRELKRAKEEEEEQAIERGKLEGLGVID